jgi:hypothetical protein
MPRTEIIDDQTPMDDDEAVDAGYEDELEDAGSDEIEDPRVLAQRYREEAKRREEYEKRFKGLQARVQQEIEARRALEAKLMEQEAAAAALKIEELPEEQRPYAHYLLRMEQEQRRLQQERALEQQAMVQILKEHKANTLAAETGAPKDFLLQFDTPEEMEAAAKALATERKRSGKAAVREARRSSGADAFESGGGQPVTTKRPSNYEEARALLRKLVTGR